MISYFIRASILLGAIPSLANLPFFPLVDELTVRHLEITEGASLARSLTRTKTKLGTLSLGELISNPTADITEIYRRQRIIRKLTGSPTLCTKLTQLLTAFAHIEQSLLSIWQDDTSLPSSVVNRLYPPRPLQRSVPITQKPLAFELFRRCDDGAVLCFLPLALLHVKSALQGSNFRSGKEIFYHGSQLLLALVTVPFTLYEIIQHFRLVTGTLEQLHHRYQYVASGMRTLHELYTTLHPYRHTLEVNQEIAPLINLFLPNPLYPQLQQLYRLLTSPLWKQPFSYFSSMGTLLTVHSLLMQLKQELIPALAAVGSLDAYLSLALLMQERGKNAYCFVQCAQYEKPFIKATKLWNPFIKNGVANDIAVGVPYGPRGMIITGQHSGGKSTLLKTVLIAVLLGQSVGIAPAQSMICTPFACITSYLHMSDNILEKRSLFTTEVTRAKWIKDTLSQLSKGQKALVVFDEMFKGGGGEGQELTYHYVEQLMKFPQAITLHATHYPRLTELEAQTAGGYQNYKMEVAIQEGKLVRTYSLARGSTLYTISQHIVAEEGL